MGSEPKTAIPIVDLSPFLCGGGGGDEAGVKLATETIGEACRHYGFFWIVNHGVPREHMARAIELSQAFFALPDEEKRKVKPAEGSKAPLPAGYSRQPEHSADKNDKTALIVQDIVNECMGLPANFLKEYNSNRSFDFMTALRYFPTTGAGDNRLSEHQDGNCLTFVFQDDIGGLEVLKDGEWIPVDPTDGSIIVNFTTDIGEKPRYRKFLYNEYIQLRMRNKTHPPSRPEDVIHITHYAV
ncbi:Gibberellin 20 oxidase 5 [Ananas comosus]|uniref:Gibberellin 20 oxidase 5 n=1 Tax=Ananas comosus TaxID=4615 RepID=A0A199V1G1_ANACO|nr:Gibberellin 20 oxidase 5 [Ananas comosus]